MTTNQKALLLDGPKGEFTVGTVDIPEPGEGELQVKIHATALNPVDWIVRELNIFIEKYPAILGFDAAGVVSMVGKGVNNFAVGDRVLYCGRIGDRLSCFQQYSITPADIAAKIPDNLTLDQASTVPLTMATAAVGLYGKKTLDGTSGAGLYPPWEEGGRGKYDGEPIVIFGAGSNVGCHVVQWARLSGFSPIIVTASKAKEECLKSYGATHVLDRHTTPVSEVPAAVKTITDKPIKIIYDAVSQADTENAGYDTLASGGTLIVLANFALDKSKITADKEVSIVNGNFHGAVQREIGMNLYANLTQMLEAGDIKPSATIEVLPGGLAGIPDGLARLQSGNLSAAKFVGRPLETS